MFRSRSRPRLAALLALAALFAFVPTPLTPGILAADANAAGSSTANATSSSHAMSLFDGKTLNGWNVENECKVEVQDETILLKEGNGWLRSDLTYADFKLHVEWKSLKTSAFDSGIYIRTSREGKSFPKPAYQINLKEGLEGNIGPLPGATSQGLCRAPGEWNAFDITVAGDTVALEINGRPAYKVAGLTARSGYIGLQCEVLLGGQFQFRNMKIVELGYRSLFNGVDLAGWDGAGGPAESCWRVTDGNLECTGQKGPWLRSRDQFDDFDFRVEYQVSDGGNSGALIRVPLNGNHHRADESQPPAGFEVQMLDDFAPKHSKLKDYQYSASLYDIVGANPRNTKPVGQWNTMEIQCRGQHVTITHNGQVVVDADVEHYPLLKLRSTAGYIGLQNHSTLVRFRNVRCGPPIPDKL